VGVRDGAKNGSGVEKRPKMARDVPVRDAPDSGGSETGAAPGDPQGRDPAADDLSRRREP